MKKIVALVLSLVMVLGLATTAFAAFDEDATYYLQCMPSGGFVEATFVEGEALSAVSGTIDHFEATIGGDVTYWVACDKADSDGEAIWDGTEEGDSKLTYVCSASIYYANVGVKVDASKLSCTTDKNAKGYKVMNADGVTYTYYKDAPADATTGIVNLLVDGEVVETVAQTETTEYVFGGHALAKYKSAALDVKKTGYEYKCVVCGEVFDGYTKKVAGVTYVPYVADDARNDAYAAAGYDMTNVLDVQTLYLVAPAVEAPADKVESAQTFDAGIAMYVGMSVMAAAGSAVVLKKKD